MKIYAVTVNQALCDGTWRVEDIRVKAADGDEAARHVVSSVRGRQHVTHAWATLVEEVASEPLPLPLPAPPEFLNFDLRGYLHAVYTAASKVGRDDNIALVLIMAIADHARGKKNEEDAS